MTQNTIKEGNASSSTEKRRKFIFSAIWLGFWSFGVTEDVSAKTNKFLHTKEKGSSHENTEPAQKTRADRLFYTLKGKFIEWPKNANPKLSGGKDAKEIERKAVVSRHLPTFPDHHGLEAAIAKKILVRVPDNGRGFSLDKICSELPDSPLSKEICKAHKSLRREAAYFLYELASAFSDEFPESTFRVTSLIRSESYLKMLLLRNGNANPTSSHMRGITMDISHKDMEPKHKAWLSQILLRLEKEGLVQVTLEKQQSCIHICVLRPLRKGV